MPATGEQSPSPQFDQAMQRCRPELLAYCYRMVGSGQDAEDLVQETYLRAWRAYATFEGRSSLRSWLYKIATNVCLTWLEARKLRVLPSSLAAASEGPPREPRPVQPADAAWLEPFAEHWSSSATSDPGTILVSRQSLRLALIASLQYLPAAQRAIFVLREVLSFSASEAAEILGTTVIAIKSGLQRARARLDALNVDPEDLLEPNDERAQQLLAGYIAAFERADASLLLQVLRADATLEATPFGDWQAGRVNCVELLARYVLRAPAHWRMLATTANGQPAAVVYERSTEGTLQSSGIVVLSATTSGISRVVAFHHEPALVERFCFPATLSD